MELNNLTLNNKYRILHKISEGRMSFVYYAEDLENQQNPVAVKVLKSSQTSDRIDDLIRFRSESTIVSHLEHPNVIKIHSIGELEDYHHRLQFIVMDYFEGKALKNYLDNHQKIEFEKCLNFMIELTKTIDFLHKRKIIHKDIKPGNILVNEDFSCFKIIDFGLSQIKESNYLDEAQGISGTFNYMAPEQSGILKSPIDEKSDLYSLGIVFYQLLTGKLPFEGENVYEIIYQHITKNPDPIKNTYIQVPEPLEKIIFKLLEKEPEKRYHSAFGLLKDLEKVKNGNRQFLLGMDDSFIKITYRTSLIGRQAELNRLSELFHQAVLGKGNFCLVRGESGLGKTRLIEEFKQQVISKNSVFMSGKCFSGENKIPYGPFKDALNLYLKQYRNYSLKRKDELYQ